MCETEDMRTSKSLKTKLLDLPGSQSAYIVNPTSQSHPVGQIKSSNRTCNNSHHADIKCLSNGLFSDLILKGETSRLTYESSFRWGQASVWMGIRYLGSTAQSQLHTVCFQVTDGFTFLQCEGMETLQPSLLMLVVWPVTASQII